jgi:methylamine dehydrogenase accessory protein MauD
MSQILSFSVITLWGVVLLLGFLLLGTLRALGVVRWQLEQLQATTPSRIGRDGIKLGAKAPPFTLATVSGGEGSLRDFLGRRVLLVFTQSGCGPCHDIVPELNRVRDRGEHQVVVVNNGDPDGTRRWAAEVRARFPVFIQEKFVLSRRYEVFATPFAFVIDEAGAVTSKGIVGTREHLGYVLKGVGRREKPTEGPSGSDGTEQVDASGFSSSREVTLV